MQVESSHKRHLLRSSLLQIIVLAACLHVKIAQADEEQGARLFGQCKACHDIGDKAKHHVGPHLDSLFNRKAGALEGFKYSTAMQKAGQDGLTWTPKTLDSYLQKPREFVPGNRMSYRGMENSDERKALITYLASFAAAVPAENPAPAPVTAPAGQASNLVDIVLAIKGDKEYGEYLSGDCVTCHQLSGHTEGIPSIVGLPRDYFVQSLLGYKINVRSNEVMKLRANNLANEDIAALAEYFGSLTPK
jgi:cytochrome c